MSAAQRRKALFLVACVALIGFAALAAHSPLPADAPGASSAGKRPRAAIAHLGAAMRAEAGLRAAGRRFVSAFLRAEVGNLSPRVERSLRALAKPGFARLLVAGAPRRVGLLARPARIAALDVSFLAASARRALLSGVARRPDGPEEFSFLFALREGRWLALGATE